MAIILSDACNGFVEILPDQDDCKGDLEDYIGNKLGYNMDDLQWISVDEMRVHIDGKVRDIHISVFLDALRLRDKIDIWKIELRERLAEYREVYISGKTESLDILEYGENEFFGGKKEVYEDILDYMKRKGL